MRRNESHIALIFHLRKAFLSKVEYFGLQLLSQKQIEKFWEAASCLAKTSRSSGASTHAFAIRAD